LRVFITIKNNFAESAKEVLKALKINPEGNNANYILVS
jgi:hypothetical protein